MKLPLALQILKIKIQKIIGASQNYMQLMPSIASQMITYRDKYPVKNYNTIEELSSDMSKVKWTEDPWDGNLDVIKHPTFFMEAIVEHPDYADDCDGFAAFAAVAIKKNFLASEVWFSTAYWPDANKNTIDGHAVCVYKDKSGWHWIGNFNKGIPYNCSDRNSWVSQLEDIVKSKVVAAYMFPADRDRRDSLILLPPLVIR